MDLKSLFEFIESLRVKPDEKVKLSKWDTDYDHKMVTKEEGVLLLEQGVKRLSQMQDMLYAHDQYSMLLVFQAMDAAGASKLPQRPRLLATISTNTATSRWFKWPLRHAGCCSHCLAQSQQKPYSATDSKPTAAKSNAPCWLL
jgi:hypothetical protein